MAGLPVKVEEFTVTVVTFTVSQNVALLNSNIDLSEDDLLLLCYGFSSRDEQSWTLWCIPMFTYVRSTKQMVLMYRNPPICCVYVASPNCHKTCCCLSLLIVLTLTQETNHSLWIVNSLIPMKHMVCSILGVQILSNDF